MDASKSFEKMFVYFSLLKGSFCCLSLLLLLLLVLLVLSLLLKSRGTECAVVAFFVSSLFCFNNLIKLFLSSLGFINSGSFLFFFIEPLFLFCENDGFKCSRLMVIFFFISVIYFLFILLLVIG